MTTLDRKQVKEIVEEIDDVLQTYAEVKGVQLKVTNTRFSDVEFTTKITVVMAETKGEAERISFEKNAPLLRLEKTDYGATVDLYGQIYNIVGANPKRRKYPLTGERDGKKFKLPLNDYVRQEIEKQRLATE